ncbi:MAG: response regulator [Lachnospiraceae bacterium]|nr:response regulator [Lachnospiraceae bacterium]
MFSRADHALFYLKKSNHKGNYNFFTDEFQEKDAKKRLLVIDDQEISRAILSSCFDHDFKMLEAENGKEGLQLMRAYKDEISAVLLDIEMPVMNGYEVLQIVRDDLELKKIPILVITVYDKSELQVLELGAVDIITKLFDPLVVKKRVKNAIKISEMSRYQKK